MNKNKLNVLLVAVHDWAAIGEQYARCLRSIGVNATMLVQNKHKFNYPHQGTLFRNIKQLMPYVKKANIIHLMHGQNPIPVSDLKGKKIVISHTGSGYRVKHKELNEILNPIADLTIVSGDLFGKGAKNEHWFEAGIVDVEVLKPVYERTNDKIIIGHFPSNPSKKGSKQIAKTMKNVKGNFEFRYDPKKVSWEDQIKRISECDIYIEVFDGSCGYGMTALEAASLGKILFSPYIFADKYRETHGNFAPIVFKGSEELVSKLEKVISLSDDELLRLKKRMRAWVEKHHSYKAVGEKLLILYMSIL